MNTMYKEEKRFQVLAHIILGIFAFLCLFPFLLMFMSSISDEGTIIRTGYSIFPKKFSLSAYKYIIREWAQIVRAYGITVTVTLAGTLVGLTLTLMLGYVLSRKKLPGRKFLNFYVFFTMLFHGGLVPTYLLYTNYLHIKNTIFALMVPSLLVSGFYTMITRSFINSNIPEELIEASRIDGAGEFKAFRTIVVPLSKPIVVTLVIFIGLGYWNDWLNGMYYLTNTKLFSIQNILNRILSNVNFLASNSNVAAQAGASAQLIPSITVRMAIAIVGIIPVMVIYPFLQKYFIKGITLGAVKG